MIPKRRACLSICEQLILLSYQPKGLFYDAERDLLAIAKFSLNFLKVRKEQTDGRTDR